MKNKNKKYIDEYIQPLYIPNKLVVCKNVSIVDLSKLYIYPDDTELTEDTENRDYDASTFTFLKDKKTGDSVVLVLLNAENINKSIKKNKNYLVGLCAHEALHVVYRILSYCDTGLNEFTNETFAYFTEWATKCIYETAIKK